MATTHIPFAKCGGAAPVGGSSLRGAGDARSGDRCQPFIIPSGQLD